MARRAPIDPRLWRYARSARPYLVLTVAFSVLTTVAIVVTAVALARVLAGVITDPAARSFGAWTPELLALAAALTGRAVVTWWQSRLAHRAGASVVAELERAVLAAGTALPPRELERHRTELAVVVGTGLGGLRGYLTGYLPALLLAVPVPPIVLAVIALHDPLSGGIVLVTLPLIPIFMVLIGLLTQGRAAATLAATTRLSDQVLDLFAGMPTLRALGREGGARSIAGVVAELGESLRVRTMRTLRVAFLSSAVLELLATLSVALVAVSIGLRLVFGEMGLYAGLVALILAPEVYLPLRTVGERFHAAQDGMAAADRAFAVLGSEPGGSGGAAGSRTAAATAVRRVERVVAPAVIELERLSVDSRSGAAPCALSAVLRPGAVTVLTGPNGCGKSTALQVMLGLAAPDSGRVTVDGTEVAGLDPEQWWSRLAWLPQRPVLVPGTLRENLELLGAHPVDLDLACAATGFDAVLAELPNGWDTVVGVGGAGLSLGQRQRLALTRVLCADRPVLLLDEPTAHLDAASEAAVLAALRERAAAGATVVVVGHRESVLAAGDVVVEVAARVGEVVP
ncbi:thiol reductant ABC exporter subunit CydD [Nocardia asteroides]|uniref:thiol reductant ABC exporter subunit CydD n=1 Tax=Nocardia asteroides TaxID=1824 RepID=UPI001E28C87D|nr:thiol reductant ABC exporter subunit CydD [Nocardia asteroides]UGT59747.1 thiol reductant ABC exporter subunit CydD [Nocardia asteroides]